MKKTEKIKLSISKFLKIIPDRLKRIESASDGRPKPRSSYKPNALAEALHPRVQHLTVTETRDLSSDVRLFTLRPDASRGTERLAPFSAGQYITVFVRVGDRVLSRPYSITSAPYEASEKYEIAVKRKNNGGVSDRIHETWRPGTAVDVSEPMGVFTYEPLRDAADVVAVAGGVGVTPFRSIVRSVLHGDCAARLTLIYGARDRESLLFFDEFSASAESGVIRFIPVTENGDGAVRGVIGADIISEYAPGTVYSLFICGPQAMYRALGAQLPALGLRRKYVRAEVFGQITDPWNEPDATVPDRGVYTVTVRRNGAEEQILCRADESLLSAMERAGIDAPSRCRSGECGFCHSRLVTGECFIPERCDRRREADAVYGYIHPCCAFPRSDLTLEINPV